MWEGLLLLGVVSAERRSCGIYIAGRVHIDTKKRSYALRYIWEREFTCHCKSEALHLCWKSSKEEHVFSDRENPREVPAGNKAANVASVLGKKQNEILYSLYPPEQVCFRGMCPKILELPKALLTPSSGSLSSSVTGDITGWNLPVSHFSPFSGRKHNLMQHLPLFHN